MYGSSKWRLNVTAVGSWSSFGFMAFLLVVLEPLGGFDQQGSMRKAPQPWSTTYHPYLKPKDAKPTKNTKNINNRSPKYSAWRASANEHNWLLSNWIQGHFPKISASAEVDIICHLNLATSNPSSWHCRSSRMRSSTPGWNNLGEAHVLLIFDVLV